MQLPEFELEQAEEILKETQKIVREFHNGDVTEDQVGLIFARNSDLFFDVLQAAIDAKRERNVAS